MRNISLNAHYIVLFKSPRDKLQVSTLARQVSPGKVQEFMRSYEEATSRPHGYFLLDLKPTTDDGQRLKTNILPGEDSPMTDIAKYVKKQSYRQPPVLDAIYNTEQRINNIMQTSQLPSSVKSKLYSSQLNRLLTLKNKLQSPMVIDQSVAQPEEEIHQFIPETPKPYFLTPPPTEERAQLKRSFFHNWVDSADWIERERFGYDDPRAKRRIRTSSASRKAKVCTYETRANCQIIPRRQRRV